MNNLIGIAGHSGSGKSTSLRNLNPQETFIISITGKPLPIKGFRKMYQPFVVNKEEKKIEGNYYVSSNIDQIVNVLQIIDKKLPNIKQVVLEDFNYLMSLEAMDRALEKGWDKSVQMASHYYNALKAATQLRDNLKVVIISHIDNLGDAINPEWKLKTLGKMLNS